MKSNGFPGQQAQPDVKMTPIFQPTLQFRWLVKGRKKTLQQYYYATNTGDSEWKDIPEVKEIIEEEAFKG